MGVESLSRRTDDDFAEVEDRLGRPYQTEVKALNATYFEALHFDVDVVASYVSTVQDASLLPVGSGGSYVAGSYIAAWHERAFGSVSRAVTPLDFGLIKRLMPSAAVMLLTARGVNRDILSAARAAIALEPRGIMGLCSASDSAMERLLKRAGYRTGSFPLSFGKDGFLATNSLFSICVVIARVYENISQQRTLPKTLGDLLGEPIANTWLRLRQDFEPLSERKTLHILYGGEAAKLAALDLEMRLSEAALLNASVSDLRSFGHGRHLWLAKRASDSAVLLMSDQETSKLAGATAKIIPDDVPRLLLNFTGDLAVGPLRALLSSIVLAGVIAEIQDTDPGRPSVPAFGRALFSLSSAARRRATHADVNEVVVERKTRELSPSADPRIKDFFDVALDRFIVALHSAHFRALALDYDGTCISSDDRAQHLSDRLWSRIQRLVANKVTVCFATGRGDSLAHQLLSLVPNDQHDGVILSVHNGGKIASLRNWSSTRLVTDGNPTADGMLTQFASAFNDSCVVLLAEMRVHQDQLSILPRYGTSMARLAQAIRELVESCAIRVALKYTGHSIDVVPGSRDKADLLAFLESRRSIQATSVLCIADKGKWPGNDFAILSAPYSLSVGEVSSSASSCWHLAPRGLLGPAATEYYLGQLQLTHDPPGFTFNAKIET